MRSIPVSTMVPPEARAGAGAEVTDLRGRPVLTSFDEDTIMSLAGYPPIERLAFAVQYLNTHVGEVLRLLETVGHPSITENPTVAELRRAAVVADTLAR
jgi:hypothetical protein